MHERPMRFGRAQHLLGIVGQPSCDPRTTGVIVLNAGLVHRVGPFRMHVQMTRQLNVRGFPTLRFDLSTLGDSGASHEAQSREQQVLSDVSSAMALLREQANQHEAAAAASCWLACVRVRRTPTSWPRATRRWPARYSWMVTLIPVPDSRSGITCHAC